MKYPKMDWGTMEAIVNKLGGMKGVKRFLRGELVVSEAACPTLKIWKTIQLGGFENVKALLKALNKAGCEVSCLSKDIMNMSAFTISSQITEIDLVVVSGAELGFKHNATRMEIFLKAQEQGLFPCPAEVGPQLRRQYTDQPEVESLTIAMEPIPNSVGDLNTFEVKCYILGKRLLDAINGNPHTRWFPSSRWVFSRPRK